MVNIKRIIKYTSVIILVLVIMGCQDTNKNKEYKKLYNEEYEDKKYNIDEYNKIKEECNSIIEYLKKYGENGIDVNIKKTEISKYVDGYYKTVVLLSDNNVKITLKFDNEQTLIGLTVMTEYDELPKEYYDIKIAISNYPKFALEGDSFMPQVAGTEKGPTVVNGWEISSTIDYDSPLHIFAIQKNK